MKSIIALGVGLVVALAPGGTAFAAPVDNATGKSTTAWGNCMHSSAGGERNPLDPTTGPGNGGFAKGGVHAHTCKEAGTTVVKEVEKVVVISDEVDDDQSAEAAS